MSHSQIYSLIFTRADVNKVKYSDCFLCTQRGNLKSQLSQISTRKSLALEMILHSKRRRPKGSKIKAATTVTETNKHYIYLLTLEWTSKIKCDRYEFERSEIHFQQRVELFQCCKRSLVFFGLHPHLEQLLHPGVKRHLQIQLWTPQELRTQMSTSTLGGTFLKVVSSCLQMSRCVSVAL